jgi:hypothetical protein
MLIIVRYLSARVFYVEFFLHCPTLTEPYLCYPSSPMLSFLPTIILLIVKGIAWYLYLVQAKGTRQRATSCPFGLELCPPCLFPFHHFSFTRRDPQTYTAHSEMS